MPRKPKDELKEINKENIVSDKIKKVDTQKRKVAENTKKSKLTSKKSTSAKTSKSNKTTKSSPISSKKGSSKKSTVSKKTTKNVTKKQLNSIVEYYDLPYRYNETVVKILAQTPTTLFIYWDISDNDRASYTQKYGTDFFNKTKPILIVTNKTMNYSFEVEINDFANNWYLHVNDANCDYSVELGRRPIEHNSNIDNYVYITTSNNIEMPNNHILFDKLGKSVFFRNVKNNTTIEYPIESISFMKKLGNVCKLYREIYKNEINTTELHSNNIILNLSSSSSSTFM